MTSPKAPRGRTIPAQGKEPRDAALGPPPPQNPSHEGAGHLPGGWTTVALSEIAETSSGGTPSRKDPKNYDGKIPWIKSGNLKDGFINQADEFISEAALKNSAAKLFPKGALLIALYGATIGKLGILKIEAATNQAVCGIFADKRVSTKFLFWYLISHRQKLMELGQGGAQPNISQQIVKNISIPLPPLAEQKRIVSKIEELFSELDAGEESLRRARRQLGVYRQSLLKQAFEGKLTAPWRAQHPDLLESPDQLLARIQSERQSRYQHQLKEWEKTGGGRGKPTKPTALKPFDAAELIGDVTLPTEWVVLTYGDLCSLVRNGISQKPSGESGFKIARISAVRPMAFDMEDFRFIDCSDAMAAEYSLSEGDLVFTRYNGARRFVGVCAYFGGQSPRLYPDKLIRTCPDLASLDSRFLEIALNTGLSRAWIETKIRTTAGQSGVSGGDVKAMPVPLCSLPEQQEIVRLLDAQFEVLAQNEREIDAALKRSAALRQSILKKAFTGQLVPQDPTDELASTLLDMIQKERESQEQSVHRKKKSLKII